MNFSVLSITALLGWYLAFGSMIASAGGGDVKASSPMQLQEATSVNAMASDLLLARIQHGDIGNAMVSSVSLYYALAILTEGASQQTLDLLYERLKDDSAGELDLVAPALARSISSPFVEGDPRGAFSLSNSLWANSGSDEPPRCQDGMPFEFKDDFLARAATLYGASHQVLDFASVESSAVINAWAEEQTRGLVPEVIDHETLECLDWAIVNTATFEGAWAMPAQRLASDSDYRFLDIEGVSQPADTLRATDHIAPVVDFADGSFAFELPFSGGKYAFIVHTPAKTVEEVGSWLIHESIPRSQDVVRAVLLNAKMPNELTVQMPIFSFSDSVEMKETNDIPKLMGIESLFLKTAKFGRLSKLPSYVSIIKQNTRLEFDENGVKAAAATLVGGKVVVTSVRPSFARREIIIDRPFSFAIVERSTGTMLFNGVVTSVDNAE